MQIEKSINIAKPVADVYKIVSDFHHWQAWSPWLIFEPDATVDVTKDGKFYSWNGKLVGAGEMKVTEENGKNEIKMDLAFLKPWKSKAKVWFNINDTGGHCQVTWGMTSSLPFFLFWMKKMMVTLIGMDYQRGLSMLKDYAETNVVPSKLSNEGSQAISGFHYIGINQACSIAEVGDSMGSDFEKLTAWVSEHEDQVAGHPFSIYHKWDMVKSMVNYTSGFPVKEPIADLPEGFVQGDNPAVTAYCILHTGPYKHLGNAWSSGMNQARSKVFKQNKKAHPFELYLDDPKQVRENEIRTRVCFPVR